jgi:hypothetical protein
MAAYYVALLDADCLLTHSALLLLPLLLLLPAGACLCGPDGNGCLLRGRAGC